MNYNRVVHNYINIAKKNNPQQQQKQQQQKQKQHLVIKSILKIMLVSIKSHFTKKSESNFLF